MILNKIYGTVYEMDENNITIEDGGVARISVPKEQMISVKVDHPYSKMFGWMIMKSSFSIFMRLLNEELHSFSVYVLN